MGGRGRAEVRRRTLGGGVSYSREFLERLARILVHSGHSPKELAREFRDICSRLKEPARRWDPKQLTHFIGLAHVITRWYTDPQYLDSRGAPIPLPLRARGPSLCALIERVLPAENPSAVAQSLARLQGVKRRGNLYLPSARYFVLPRASARVHVLTALLDMLRTIERNVAGPKTATILERTAVNPGFPVRALPAFHRRLKALAAEFLWNVDGDMRRRETEDPNGPRARVGVGVFAFEEPIAREMRGGSGHSGRSSGRKTRRRKS